MNRNKYSFKWSKIFDTGKGFVTGNIVGRRGETGTPTYEQIQEHKETIYAIGWLRVIVYHDFKFIRHI